MSDFATPAQVARDTQFILAAVDHQRSPSRVPPPDAHLLAHEGAGVIGRAEVTTGRDGSPVVVLYFTAGDGSLRRGRAFAPRIATALKVALWFGMKPGASAGSLCADPQTAWFFSEGKGGPLAREQAMTAALSMQALHHAASGLSRMGHADYWALLVAAFDLAMPRAGVLTPPAKPLDASLKRAASAREIRAAG